MKKHSLAIIILILPLLVIGCKEEDIDFAGLRVIIVGEEQEEIAGEILFSKGRRVIREQGPRAEISGLPTGSYEIEVKHENYKAFQETINLYKDTTRTINLEPENNKDVAEENEKKKENFSIKLEIYDINNNPLDVKTVIIKDGSIIASTQDSKAVFYELKRDNYTINISKDGYQAFEQQIDLSSNLEKEIILGQGPIKQEIISSGDTVDIDNLAKNQKAILAIAPLDFAEHKQVNNYNLTTTYYNYSGARKDREFEAKSYDYPGQLDKSEQESKDLTTEIIEQQQGFSQLESGKKYEFKAEKEFFVPQGVNTTDEQETVQAEMLGRGENIYVFADKRMDISLAKVDKLVAEFDNNIYPSLTKLFGTPPDVANNDKVMVLLTKFNNPLTAGFFNPEDLQDIAGSNYHDLVYLNLATGAENNLYTSLAHQFQHLLFHKNKVEAGRKTKDRWIDEGVAKLAEKTTGYIDYSKAGWSWDGGNNWVYSTEKDYPGYFMLTEQISLLDDKVSISQLGGVSLFSAYLKDQYGIELIQEIVKSSQAPIDVIDEFTDLDFEQIYLNWVTTNVTDSIATINNQIYNYKSFDLDAQPVMIEIDDDSQKDLAIKGGGVEYLKLYGQNSDIQLSITSESDKFALVKIIKDKE